VERFRKLLLNSLLLIGSVFFVLILAEGVTRLVMPNSVRLRLMHQPDKRLGYRLVPNYEMGYKTSDFDSFVKINSEGLRDYEHQKDKDPNTFRILVLGDSFTFGVGVNLEDSYSKVLESMLNQSYDSGGNKKKYEVINAGIEGFGTGQEYIYLEELGIRYKPDLVIVGLFSNDINDVMSEIPNSTFTKTWLKNHLYVLSYLRGLHKILLIRSKDVKTTFFQIYQEQYPPEFKAAIQKTKEYLMKVHDFSYSNGAKTLILIVPSCFEIDRLEWDKKGFGRLYSDDFFNKNMSKFSDIFTEFGKEKSVPTLTLLPTFRNSNIRPLYFTHDPHWTKEGHRLAAESIYNFLEEKGLVH